MRTSLQALRSRMAQRPQRKAAARKWSVHERNPDNIYGLLRKRYLSFSVSCSSGLSAGNGKRQESAPDSGRNFPGDADSVFYSAVQNGDGQSGRGGNLLSYPVAPPHDGGYRICRGEADRETYEDRSCGACRSVYSWRQLCIRQCECIEGGKPLPSSGGGACNL